MAKPYVPPNNGTTQEFRDLNQDNCVINPNFDCSQALARAMKVFIMSYPEIRPTASNPVLQQKFDEYLVEMQGLYGVQQPDLSFLQSIYEAVDSEKIHICISAKRFRGRDRMRSPSLEVHVGKTVLDRDLNPRNEVQPWDPIKISTGCNVFGMYRRDPRQKLVIAVNGYNWVQKRDPLHQFEFCFARSSPEGYEQWFDFGRGVQLLLNIEYKVVNEPNITSDQVSEFHFQTIKLMLERRLDAYRNRTDWTAIRHKKVAYKYRVTYERPYVDPQSDDMFWIPTAPTTTTSLVDSLTMAHAQIKSRKRSRSTVKFADIQIPYQSALDFEDSVCLCTEFCNWNSFFHHNPIYRFLMVRHHQLYLQKPGFVPYMYQCLSIVCGCGTAATTKIPFLQLINHSNEYRKKFHDSYFETNTFFKLEYHISKPSPRMMCALAYHKLRNQFDVNRLCYDLDVNPFSDVCVESLLIYYKVLTDLHVFQSANSAYISDTRLWDKDLDVVNRLKYKDYIKQSYNKAMVNVSIGYDYMFTEDYEYSSRLPKTQAEVMIKKKRDSVLSKTTIDNPFNLKITLNNFLNTFISIYKFLSRVEPMLSGVYRAEARKEVFSAYKKLDTDFVFFGLSNKFSYEINSGFDHLKQNFQVFYVLKLYFILFEIQKHFIDSLLKYNRHQKYLSDQISESFEFIWRYTMIEHKYRDTYKGQELFNIEPSIETNFTAFYLYYWTKAHHEVNAASLTNILDFIKSGHTEYARLYFWWKNYGNIRLKFTKIIDSFRSSLKDVINRTENIKNSWIIPAIYDISQTYPKHWEMFDHLVYYLVKANCSLFLSTTAVLLKKMHSLQIKRLPPQSTCYSLTKPGWVPLFRTMYNVLANIERVKIDYIVFDDHFERITNTCVQTKRMVKGIYRQFYEKLAQDWIREMGRCLTAPSNSQVEEFLVMHLLVGLSFVSAFVDDYRLEFCKARKKCMALLKTPPDPQFTQQTQFSDCLNVVNSYLRNRDVIRNAIPFHSVMWKTHLAPLIAKLDQNTGQNVHIDLNAADV